MECRLGANQDVVVIGAGAAGMMCAAEAGKRGRSVLIIDHAATVGEKIRISGGGRCNFTNIHSAPRNYLSRNPHFCISALSRYTAQDFVKLVERHGIAYHEKTLGQLFCNGPATQVVDLLLAEMRDANVAMRLATAITKVEKVDGGFALTLAGDHAPVHCQSLVIATGGKSVPKMGASDFGYRLAAQFGIAVTETRPGLVPLVLSADVLARLKPLAGISTGARVTCGRTTFDEAILVTHRGLSGPAILQISSYWREGDTLEIDLVPGIAIYDALRALRRTNGRQLMPTIIGNFLPKRLARFVADTHGLTATQLADTPDARLKQIAENLKCWRVQPSGSEGYRVAEVTLGGVDTLCLDSKTLAAKAVPGLHFIGEVVDVTGWLGGFNFQWAWSSGWCAGQVA